MISFCPVGYTSAFSQPLTSFFFFLQYLHVKSVNIIFQPLTGGGGGGGGGEGTPEYDLHRSRGRNQSVRGVEAQTEIL